MHTPVDIGFFNEPRVKAFAERVGCQHAGAMIVRLHEFVILKGSHDGKLPGFTLDELIQVMEAAKFPRARLVRALTNGRFLRKHKKTWLVPDWPKTVAGRYCAIRKWERDRKQEFREAKAAAALAQVEAEQQVGTEPGRPGAVPVASSGRMRSTNKSGPERTDSEAASGGGDAGGLARWEWFKTLHPRLDNPDLCRRLLGKMDAETWAQLQYALPIQALEYRGRSTRRVALASKYLSSQLFWEKKKEEPRKVEPKPKPTKAEQKAAAEQKERDQLKFFRELMADADLPKDRKVGYLMKQINSDVTEKVKEAAKALWLKTYGDRPWEDGKGG